MFRDVMKFEMDTDSKYGVTFFKREIPAGTSYPLHWHDFIEFEIILSGRAKHIYNDREFVLNKGNAYMMCYYDFHELTALTDIVLYSIHFNKSMLHPEIVQFLDYNKFHCHFDKDETNRIVQRMEELVKECNTKIPLQTVVIKNIINELVVAMIRACPQKEIQPAPLPIQQAVAFLNDHFLEKITLDVLAKQLSFSTNYLGMMFKKQMGCTFNEYVNTLRLKYACSLLRSSDMSIKEVADASGYSSIEYFMYAFKKKMLMTPGEYRKAQIPRASL